jgi:hypothetical protein
VVGGRIIVIKKHLGIVVLVLFITNQSQAKVKYKDINCANAFYEDSIQSWVEILY